MGESTNNVCIAFACVSILCSILILARLFYLKKGKLNTYDRLFVVLQMANFVSQAIVLVYETMQEQSDFYYNLMIYLAGLNILGVVFTNLQSLRLFSVLDYRITPQRIMYGYILAIVLFLSLTSLSLRNLIESRNAVMMMKKVEDQYDLAGQALMAVWTGLALIYDNIQAVVLYRLVYDLNQSKKRKNGALQVSYSSCPMVKLGVYSNLGLILLDWGGFFCSVYYLTRSGAEMSSKSYFVVATTIISGTHNAWMVLNFYILRFSALLSHKKQPSPIVKAPKAYEESAVKVEMMVGPSDPTQAVTTNPTNPTQFKDTVLITQ